MKNRINQIPNPWDNFLNPIPQTPKYLEGDKEFIDAYQKYLDPEAKPTSKKNPKDEIWKEANELHLELIPEPFEGNPEAPIYLLGGNPGYCEDDKKWHEKEDYLDIMSATLSHKYHRNQNNPTDFAFFDKRLEGYGGTKWWEGHIVDEIKDKIFNIEFCAYHSTKADGLKGFLSQIAKEGQSKPTCISNQYADQLIYRAIKNKKIIIITRFEKYWLERIKDLEEYDNLYILLNYQIATVKKGNIIDYQKYKDLKSDSWSDLLNKVKP